jgi:tetratricopeptide (TPR) repeat protein
VLVDAFGKGAFVAAIKGESLYKASVLKTGADGRATVEIQGRTQEVPPAASVRISDALAAGAKKGGLGWFAAVGNLVQSFGKASRKKESLQPLGSRATNAAEAPGMDGMEWEVEETEPRKVLENARKLIEDGDHPGALAELAKADPAHEPALAWELSFWKGFCYFQMEDYGDAAASLSAARSLENASAAPLPAAAEKRMLLFQLGSSLFLLGQEKAAVPPLEALLAENGGEAYEPYAALLLARALAAAGEAGRSRAVAAQWAKRSPGSPLEAEFAALAR